MVNKDKKNYFPSDPSEYLSSSKDTICNREEIRLPFDYPVQIKLPSGCKLCGYIEPDGTYHQCEHCGHLKMIRKLILRDYLEEYMNLPDDFFDRKPWGDLQEEYFALKALGWVKISSFKLDVNTMYSFRYRDKLTPEQVNLIYPT